MKNLMTYIHPSHEFTENYVRLVKVQIDNSLYTGWKAKDILLITNFEYSYRNINAIVVPDELFCNHRKKASKINVICYMLDHHMIDDVCWFHDFDAYQVNSFPKEILCGYDAAFTDYGFNTMWNTGSFFFTLNAKDIFELIRKKMYVKLVNEEIALKILTDRNVENINSRYLKLNNTFNLGRMRHNELTYGKADKPIKVFHFHPRMTDLYQEVKPLLPRHLIEIIKNHGY